MTSQDPNPQATKSFREVNGPCIQVDPLTYSYYQTYGLTQIRTMPPLQRAVVLNTYRLNFGSDLSTTLEELGGNAAAQGMPQTMSWNIEVATANLAWNITRVHVHLVEHGNLDGPLDNDLAMIVNALVGMESLPRRDLSTGVPFPIDMPDELWTWHDEQPIWITARNMQNHLHESPFYEEEKLRDFVEVIRERVSRLKKPARIENEQLLTPESMKGTVSKEDGKPGTDSTPSDWSGLEEFSSELDAAIASHRSESTMSDRCDTDMEILDRELFGTPEPEDFSLRTGADNNTNDQLPTPESTKGVQPQSESPTAPEYDSDSELSDVASDEAIEFMRLSGILTPVRQANHGWNANIPLNHQERSTRNKKPNYKT